MRGVFWGAAVSLCIACGGRASLLESAGASGATQGQATSGGAGNAGASNASGAAGASSAAGTSAGAVTAGGAGAGGATGIGGDAYGGGGVASSNAAGGTAGAPVTTSEYVPDHAQPFDQTYLEDGSFESSNGHGWDTCYSHIPAVVTRAQNEASDGTRSFEFTSGTCPNCSYDGPSNSQVYSWFTEQPTTALSLYFDVLSLSNAPPLGELRLETTDKFCRPLRPLTVVQLSDLLIEQTWQTRCVDLPAFGSDPALGIAVAGMSFDIALEALRLGPPCHAH